MATSYAALVSLMHTLNRAQHHSCPVTFNRYEIHYMFRKVGWSIFLSRIPNA